MYLKCKKKKVILLIQLSCADNSSTTFQPQPLEVYQVYVSFTNKLYPKNRRMKYATLLYLKMVNIDELQNFDTVLLGKIDYPTGKP